MRTYFKGCAAYDAEVIYPTIRFFSAAVETCGWGLMCGFFTHKHLPYTLFLPVYYLLIAFTFSQCPCV